MTSSEDWLAARNAEIEALQPSLLCRVMAPDVQPGQPKPCNALTPADMRKILYERTGISGWKVRIASMDPVGMLEILPPDEP